MDGRSGGARFLVHESVSHSLASRQTGSSDGESSINRHRQSYGAGGAYIRTTFKKYLKDASREFDEFRVNTHLCKLRCWYS